MNWWQRVRHRWRLEDQLDAELRFHFDQLVRDYVKEGARRRASRSLCSGCHRGSWSGGHP